MVYVCKFIADSRCIIKSAAYNLANYQYSNFHIDNYTAMMTCIYFHRNFQHENKRFAGQRGDGRGDDKCIDLGIENK